MLITIEIPDELIAQAHARGLALDRTLPALLAEELAAEPENGSVTARAASHTTLTPTLRKDDPDQRRHAVDAMVAFADKYGVTTGGQDLKSMIHEGHKY
jgi:hypothetical protein